MVTIRVDCIDYDACPVRNYKTPLGLVEYMARVYADREGRGVGALKSIEYKSECLAYEVVFEEL